MKKSKILKSKPSRKELYKDHELYLVLAKNPLCIYISIKLLIFFIILSGYGFFTIFYIDLKWVKN